MTLKWILVWRNFVCNTASNFYGHLLMTYGHGHGHGNKCNISTKKQFTNNLFTHSPLTLWYLAMCCYDNGNICCYPDLPRKIFIANNIKEIRTYVIQIFHSPQLLLWVICGKINMYRVRVTHVKLLVKFNYSLSFFMGCNI